MLREAAPGYDTGCVALSGAKLRDGTMFFESHHTLAFRFGRAGRVSFFKLSGLLLLLSLLAGCAHYQPLPESALAPAELTPPDHAWTLAEATRFALEHNPTLIESKTRLELARRDAGLAKVPPPLGLGFSLDHPWEQGLFNAFSLSVSQDLNFWLKQAPRNKAIESRLQQAILNQRWQAWQLAAAVQQQYLNLWYQQAQGQLIDGQIAWTAQRLNAEFSASAAGLITSDTRALLQANLAQWQQAAAASNMQLIKDRVQFNGLLGITADAPVNLTTPPAEALPSQALSPSSIAQRPDLLALKAAIDEQDAHYRQALIDQFPSISLGLTRAQDTSKVQTIGVGINLVLPTFDGNRHAIAVAKTSRRLATDQYRSRLMQVRTDFEALVQKRAELQRSQAEIQKNLPALRSELTTAEQAMAQGMISANTVDTLRQTLFNQQMALLQNTAEQIRANYALPALVGIAPSAMNTSTPIAQTVPAPTASR